MARPALLLAAALGCLVAIGPATHARAEPATGAREFVASVRPDPVLQAFLDQTFADLAKRDPGGGPRDRG
jgi:hypothetical protein